MERNSRKVPNVFVCPGLRASHCLALAGLELLPQLPEPLELLPDVYCQPWLYTVNFTSVSQWLRHFVTEIHKPLQEEPLPPTLVIFCFSLLLDTNIYCYWECLFASSWYSDQKWGQVRKSCSWWHFCTRNQIAGCFSAGHGRVSGRLPCGDEAPHLGLHHITVLSYCWRSHPEGVAFKNGSSLPTSNTDLSLTR